MASKPKTTPSTAGGHIAAKAAARAAEGVPIMPGTRLPEDTSPAGGSASLGRQNPFDRQRIQQLGGDRSVDHDRQSRPEQIAKLNTAIKKNLDRVAGLVRRGDYYQAAKLVQRVLAPQIGTIHAHVDALNALEPGKVHEPLLSTHIPPKVHVKRPVFKRWGKR